MVWLFTAANHHIVYVRLRRDDLRCQKVTFPGSDWWISIRFVDFSFFNSLVAAVIMYDGSKKGTSFLCQNVDIKDRKKIVCRKVLLQKNCLQRCIKKKNTFAEKIFFFTPTPFLHENGDQYLKLRNFGRF